MSTNNNYTIIQTKNQKHPTLLDNTNSYVYSKFNPEKEIDSYFKHASIEKGDLVVFLGLGLGYHLKAFQKKFPNEDQVIVYEPCSQLLAFLESHWDLSFLLPFQKKSLLLLGETHPKHTQKIKDFIQKKPFNKFHFVKPLSLTNNKNAQFSRFENYINVQCRLKKAQQLADNNLYNNFFASNQNQTIRDSLKNFVKKSQESEKFSFKHLSSFEKSLLIVYQILYSKDFEAFT